jgi:hypothetical protein
LLLACIDYSLALQSSCQSTLNYAKFATYRKIYSLNIFKT